jgi:hypothetical protein
MTHQIRTVLGGVALATFGAPGPSAARPAAAASPAQPYGHGLPPPPPPRFATPPAAHTAPPPGQRRPGHDAWRHHAGEDGRAESSVLDQQVEAADV